VAYTIIAASDALQHRAERATRPRAEAVGSLAWHVGTEDRSGATLTSGLPACPAPAGIVGSRLSGTPEKIFLTKTPRTMAPFPLFGCCIGGEAIGDSRK
jgi:hypothetical protein